MIKENGIKLIGGKLLNKKMNLSVNLMKQDNSFIENLNNSNINKDDKIAWMRYKKIIIRNKTVNGIETNTKNNSSKMNEIKKNHSFSSIKKINDSKMDLSLIDKFSTNKNITSGTNSINLKNINNLKINLDKLKNLQNNVNKHKITKNANAYNIKPEKDKVNKYKNFTPSIKPNLISKTLKFSFNKNLSKKLENDSHSYHNNFMTEISVKNKIKMFGEDFNNNSLTSSASNNNLTEIFDKTANFSFFLDKNLNNSQNSIINIPIDTNHLEISTNKDIFNNINKFTIGENFIINTEENKNNIYQKLNKESKENDIVTFREEIEAAEQNKNVNYLRSNLIISKINSNKIKNIFNIKNRNESIVKNNLSKPISNFNNFNSFNRNLKVKNENNKSMNKSLDINTHKIVIKNKSLGISIKNNSIIKNYNNKSYIEKDFVKAKINYNFSKKFESFKINTEESNRINDISTSLNTSLVESNKNLNRRSDSNRNSLNDSLRKYNMSPKIMKNHPSLRKFFE